MDTKISEIISVLPADLQQVLLQHREFIALVERVIAENEEIKKTNAIQQEHILFIESEIKRLKDQLELDSHNSSKPPSTDKGRQKITSLRKSTGRSPGGQKGHNGTTLEQVSDPNYKVDIKVNVCAHCGKDISSILPKDIEKRQVFDTPPIKIEVTEYQAEIKDCPFCGHKNKGIFPEGVDQPVQYGERIKATGVYLNQQHLIPYDRTTEIIEVLCGQSISGGTLYNTNEEIYSNLETTEKGTKQSIINSEVVRFDETGYYENADRHWLHSASTEEYTYYYPYQNRGNEGMNAAGILQYFHGIGVHDHWKAYFKYTNFTHALCNVHHLRELTCAYEQDNCEWANKVKTLLLEIKTKVDEAKEEGKQFLESDVKEYYRQKYFEILTNALILYPKHNDKGPPKRGRKKQSKSKNLLDRLLEFEKETLRFMEDFKVPFDNNLAERDIRMVKTQQKISGCFRSAEGAKYFCRIRGFISTVKKQGKNVLDYLTLAIRPSNATKNILLVEKGG